MMGVYATVVSPSVPWYGRYGHGPVVRAVQATCLTCLSTNLPTEFASLCRWGRSVKHFYAVHSLSSARSAAGRSMAPASCSGCSSYATSSYDPSLSCLLGTKKRVSQARKLKGDF